MTKDTKPKEVVIDLTEEDINVFRRVIEEDSVVIWSYDGIDIKFIKQPDEEIEEENDNEDSNIS